MPRRGEKKYHFVYKITCSLTNRFYYGIHSTDNLDDGYNGSGSELKRSLKKYGDKCHIFEIIELVDSRKELKMRESEIVNEELLSDPLCMNLIKGGGGFNTTGLIPVKDSNGKTFSVSKNDPRYLSGELVGVTKDMITAKDEKGIHYFIKKDDPRYLSGELVGVAKGRKVSDDTKKQISSSCKENHYSWKGKKHTEKAKKKMSQANRTGIKNSQYGTRWITNGILNKKIKKEDKIPDKWTLGRKI